MEALVSPGAKTKLSLKGMLELVESQEVLGGGWKGEQDGTVSLAQIPRMLWRDSFPEEPHLFSLLFCVYLLEHLHIGTFY